MSWAQFRDRFQRLQSISSQQGAISTISRTGYGKQQVLDITLFQCFPMGLST